MAGDKADQFEDSETVPEDEFNSWLIPKAALSKLGHPLENTTLIRTLLTWIDTDQVRAAAELWLVRTYKGEQRRIRKLIPRTSWRYQFAPGPHDSFWKTGSITVRAEGNALRNGTIATILTGVRFDPAGIASLARSLGAEDGDKIDSGSRPQTQPIKLGRRQSDLWRPWVAELVSYIHENGVPEGVGSQGQEELIAAVADRLAARGIEALARSTVQPVIQAVLDKLRAAEN